MCTVLPHGWLKKNPANPRETLKRHDVYRFYCAGGQKNKATPRKTQEINETTNYRLYRAGGKKDMAPPPGNTAKNNTFGYRLKAKPASRKQ